MLVHDVLCHNEMQFDPNNTMCGQFLMLFHAFLAVSVRLLARPNMLVMVRCVTASHRVAAVCNRVDHVNQRP